MSKTWRENTALYDMRLWMRRLIWSGGTLIRAALRSVCISVVRPDFSWVDVALGVALIIVLMFSIVGSPG
jgi:hypothetical protein